MIHHDTDTDTDIVQHSTAHHSTAHHSTVQQNSSSTPSSPDLMRLYLAPEHPWPSYNFRHMLRVHVFIEACGAACVCSNFYQVTFYLAVVGSLGIHALINPRLTLPEPNNILFVSTSHTSFHYIIPVFLFRDALRLECCPLISCPSCSSLCVITGPIAWSSHLRGATWWKLAILDQEGDFFRFDDVNLDDFVNLQSLRHPPC